MLAAAESAWYARLRLPFQDEGGTLALAARILRGEVFYRDLDAYALPGAAYLLAGAMRVLGDDDLLVARALAGVVHCAALLALYAAALRVVDRAAAALFALSLLGLKFLAWPMGTSYVHGDVALCFAFAAIALLLHAARDDGTWRIPGVAAAGFAAGLSLLCKQNVGILVAAAGVALLLAPGPIMARSGTPGPRLRRAAAFAAGCALPVGAAFAAFAASGVFVAMLGSAFLGPFTGYLGTSAVGYLPMLAWWELGGLRARPVSYLPLQLWELLELAWPSRGGTGALWWTLAEVLTRGIYLVAPLAIAGSVAMRLRRRSGSSPREARVLALALLAFAVFLSAFPRADVLHVLPVLPPSLLVLYALWRLGTRGRATPVEALAVGVFLLLCVAGAAISAGLRTYPVRLERAEVWVRPENAWNEVLVEAIAREIPPDAPFFVYGHEAWLYHLSGRFAPWPYVWLYPGMAGDDGGRALRERLEREPPRIVVRGMLRLPGLPALPTYTEEIAGFLRRRYAVDEGFFRGAPGGAPPPWVVQVLRLREPASASPVAPAPVAPTPRRPAAARARAPRP